MVGHVGAEIVIKAARCRTSADGLGKDLAPDRTMGLGGGGRSLGLFLEDNGALIRDGPIPAEVPLTYAGCAVAVLFCQGGNRDAIRCDQRFPPQRHDAGLEARAPMIAPSQQSVARGRANAGRRVPVGETHPLRGKLVDMRGGDFTSLRVVAPHITVTEVVGVEDHDVGFG